MALRPALMSAEFRTGALAGGADSRFGSRHPAAAVAAASSRSTTVIEPDWNEMAPRAERCREGGGTRQRLDPAIQLAQWWRPPCHTGARQGCDRPRRRRLEQAEQVSWRGRVKQASLPACRLSSTDSAFRDLQVKLSLVISKLLLPQDFVYILQRGHWQWRHWLRRRYEVRVMSKLSV